MAHSRSPNVRSLARAKMICSGSCEELRALGRDAAARVRGHLPLAIHPSSEGKYALLPPSAHSSHCATASTFCAASMSLPHHLGSPPILKFPTFLDNVDLLCNIVRVAFPWGTSHPWNQRCHWTLCMRKSETCCSIATGCALSVFPNCSP